MKILIWSVWAILLAVWTGLAFVALQVTEWIAHAAVSAEVSELKALAQQMPVPEWLPPWIDGAWVHGLQALLMSSIDEMASAFPYFSAVGWLVPVIWAFWAAGAVLSLLLAGGGHFLVSMFSSGPARA